MMRQTIGDYLEDYDYEVIVAKDGQEGLDMFQSEKPDAVLVDLNMPKVDGFKVLETIVKETVEVPVIVISGVGVMHDAIKAIHLGAWDFISKPIDTLDILSYTLDKVFEKTQLIRENREYKEELEKKVALRTQQLQDSNKFLRITQRQIISTLARAGEYRDNETGKHVIRVSKYSEIIAQTLGLSQEQADLIKKTSPLHDIGKIGVPDEILLKPGALNNDEWKKMKKHSEYGFSILTAGLINNDDVKFEIKKFISSTSSYTTAYTSSNKLLFVYACNIALFHHEKWDGSGYPLGIKGEKIPIEARITALADVYDAIGSRRPYKKSFSEDKCQSIIRELSGSHLEPAIVSAFFKSINTILEIKNHWKD